MTDREYVVISLVRVLTPTKCMCYSTYQCAKITGFHPFRGTILSSFFLIGHRTVTNRGFPKYEATGECSRVWTCNCDT